MKKLIFTFVSLTLIFATGCKKFDKLTQFNMNFEESITIESSTGVDLPFNVFSPEMETNSESTFAVNDTRKDLIEEIIMNHLKLQLTAPGGADFSFLKSIHIYIMADGLGESSVAWLDEIAESPGDLLELNVTEADLKEYIKKDKFSLRVNTVTDEFLVSDHKVDILSSFHVDAKILGQ